MKIRVTFEAIADDGRVMREVLESDEREGVLWANTFTKLSRLLIRIVVRSSCWSELEGGVVYCDFVEKSRFFTGPRFECLGCHTIVDQVEKLVQRCPGASR